MLEYQPRRPYWRLIVDEKTGYKITHFYKNKDLMVTPTCELFQKLKNQGTPVQAIRMDNAGENKSLVKALNGKNWQLYPKIEFTAKNTPQQNHLVEVGFATLYGRGRSMMTEANVPPEKRHVVGQKAFETATKLDGLIPVTIDGKCLPRVVHATGELPPFAKYLRKWGEAGVVKTKTQGTPKMQDRGSIYMFVGYSDNHSGDTYDMLNWKTRKITQTRDVYWLNRMYFQDKIQEPNNNDSDMIIEDYDSDDTHDETNSHQQPTPPADTTQTMTRSGRIVKAPERLIDEQLAFEIAAVGAGIGGGFDHTTELQPMKYNEAIQKDPIGWQKEIDKEHTRMTDNKVFKVVKKDDVPKDAKILTSTWAMKLKADGTKRARVTARGYEQKPGEHYDQTGIFPSG